MATVRNTFIEVGKNETTLFFFWKSLFHCISLNNIVLPLFPHFQDHDPNTPVKNIAKTIGSALNVNPKALKTSIAHLNFKVPIDVVSHANYRQKHF
jgi:hypothetical protein